ncbi:GNAT family N-acetyltransferase [Elizabethkingia meningoseptica]|uniref:GNAT family N-acetyltransferase n=1 Tax=Elizabethkingia meningoseptica TaxID=238 RepID=UPI0022F17AB0|nr:GNAT family N-acetyltransferase [Elizabethkingia meningoseptica]EJK5329493.1 GNAT family N-acetyltransferase [Elizabethkingia meningoseptica]MDE5469333.1 GNAT family N-acetyltransferase [Elizabethkingia meningoseptica]MDE5475247.1 GNAT family N-acetyltransferase [Elizabethkingia meningoseptica]MDE5478680.1 GNAT family N-acetyltransferase [Elizabethkingia meningoseptica]MDE5486374.1 GNAT family N-acetyltransferase [Elizabethkingia meningoseptica]
MEIRTATIQDLEALASIFEKYRNFYHQPADYETAKSFLRERITQQESVIYVAETENKIIGFTQLYPLFSSTRMKKLWLLNDLYVEEEYRQKGISVALIDRAKQLCVDTGACQLSLETSKSNVVGNNLYPKTGFQLDSETNFYYWLP